MISVHEAFELLDDNIEPLESERMSVRHALFRVAAEDVVSGIDLPPFAQSAMDGYAVRAADLSGAGEDAPVALEVVGEVAAGDGTSMPRVGAGQTVRVFTGGRIAPGADSVVRQEMVRREGRHGQFVEPVEQGRDIRPVGEELSADQTLVERGERLDERHVAALSMCGHAEVVVRRQPRITLLVSGDEVVSPGIELRSGEIYDANAPLLLDWLRARGYEDIELRHVEDDRLVVERALSEALDDSDLVVSTGGVSVGDHDHFTAVADRVGLDTVFWKVRQKPGKPLLFARRGPVPFLGLPGNPGAVFVAAYVYLRRALDLLAGCDQPGPMMHTGVLAADVRQSARRLKWVGCKLVFDDGGRAVLEPLGSNRLGTMYRADAIARIPEGDGTLEASQTVRWISL